jgi:hypothetical protein
MACYLCAYQQTQTPQTVRPLPPTSPAAPHDPLGICWRCSVAACSAHGTRYGKFECAICTPGIAAQRALTGAPSVRPDEPWPQSPAPTLARLVGEQAGGDQRQRAQGAVARLQRDHEVAPDVRDVEAIRFGEPNLIGNFAAVARQVGAPEFVAPTPAGGRDAFAGDGPPTDGVSLEAISAVVRETLSGRRLETSPESDVVALGALLLAMAVANEPESRSGGTDSVPPTEVEVLMPWDVSHPILLDPMIWVVAVAYHLAG